MKLKCGVIIPVYPQKDEKELNGQMKKATFERMREVLPCLFQGIHHNCHETPFKADLFPLRFI